MTTYAHASTPVGNGLQVPEWTFADRLRKIRTSGGWSQKEIASLLEVGSSAYAQWEAGNAKPRDVVAIANRLELMARVPAAWTLGLNDENRHPDNPNGGSQFSVHPPGLEPGTHCFRVSAEKPQVSESNVIEFRPSRDGGSIADDHAEVIPFPTRGGRDERMEGQR